MRRADKGTRRGMTPEQAAIAAAVVMALVLLLTMKVNSQWCGKTCGQQFYEALQVTGDWE